MVWPVQAYGLLTKRIFRIKYAPKYAWTGVAKRSLYQSKSQLETPVKSACTSRPFQAATHDIEDFYRFTRGRFVQNQAGEMAARYIRFNVDELATVAASSVGLKSCVHIEKFADGMHNKALLLTMDNGKQVVAKIPNPNAGQSHFTTASEVATMDLMRNLLRTPVPEVYAWCSHAENSPVGAEYIIMEKAPGVPLKSMWHKLELSDRFTITKEIARLQATWSDAVYEGYGSIYYATDLAEQHRLPLHGDAPDLAVDERFVLGPITGRDWVDDGRQSVAFDRGPWKTVEDYLEAVGRREMACVKNLPKLPPTQVTLCGPGTYQSTREKKLRALEYYLQLFRHLAPSDFAARKPSAWHGDLHIENIFVDPSEPTKVTSIIDWQSTEVAPLFVQARQPHMLDYNGTPVTGIDRPRLPSNFSELSSTEKEAANRVLLDQSLCVGYKRWIKSHNTDIWRCFEFQEAPGFELLLIARSILVDGEAIYTARVIEYLQSTNNILESSGLSVPEHVIAEIKADSEGAIRGMEAMTAVQDAMGSLFPERGCVTIEQYDEAKHALHQCKEQIINTFASTQAEHAAWEESWPFDD